MIPLNREGTIAADVVFKKDDSRALRDMASAADAPLLVPQPTPISSDQSLTPLDDVTADKAPKLGVALSKATADPKRGTNFAPLTGNKPKKPSSKVLPSADNNGDAHEDNDDDKEEEG